MPEETTRNIAFRKARLWTIPRMCIRSCRQENLQSLTSTTLFLRISTHVMSPKPLELRTFHSTNREIIYLLTPVATLTVVTISVQMTHLTRQLAPWVDSGEILITFSMREKRWTRTILLMAPSVEYILKRILSISMFQEYAICQQWMLFKLIRNTVLQKV